MRRAGAKEEVEAGGGRVGGCTSAKELLDLMLKKWKVMSILCISEIARVPSGEWVGGREGGMARGREAS